MFHPDITQAMIDDRLNHLRDEAAKDRRTRKAVRASHKAAGHLRSRLRLA